MSPTPLVIVGAGGHGRETFGIATAINERAVAAGRQPPWKLLGFVADTPDIDNRVVGLNSSIVGATADMADIDAQYVLGIGDPATRCRLDTQLTKLGCVAATLVHPLAVVGLNNTLAPGVLIAAGAQVTTNVSLERHVHVNVGAVVSHDSTVGQHSSLSPGTLLNGSVSVGRRVMLGSAAVVTPGHSIGDDSVVGAGAVVVSDVPPAVTAKGIPARWTHPAGHDR